MIKVTTLNKRRITINADLIEVVESVPETMLTLVSGRKIMIEETVDEVIEKAIRYKAVITKVAGESEEVM